MTPGPKPRPPAERFWAKVDKQPDGCWIWRGARSPEGYGVFWLDGRTPNAHRVAYLWTVGPIPNGLELDHLCRVPACVNPDHLEAVTAKVNIRRRDLAHGTGSAKTHCPKNHPYDETNTERRDGRRYCRECGNQRSRLRRQIKQGEQL